MGLDSLGPGMRRGTRSRVQEGSQQSGGTTPWVSSNAGLSLYEGKRGSRELGQGQHQPLSPGHSPGEVGSGELLERKAVVPSVESVEG